MVLDYWFMFPVAILVATTAMASGIGGATFFAPILMIGLGLPPDISIGIGLITEVFGFASGIFAFGKKQLIDYRLGLSLLIVTIPAAILGTLIARVIPSDILKVIFGVGLFAIALNFLRTPEKKDVATLDRVINEENANDKSDKTCLILTDGEQVCYKVCNKTEGRLIAGVGGLFIGLISTGLGELNSYFLLQRCRVPSKVAVATSVFVVAITALTAATGHLFQFLQTGGSTLDTVLSIVIFTVPGVVIGGQIGAGVASHISQKILVLNLGILFIIVAILTLLQVLL
jgi:uncharacterized membrane protein YfcA